MLQNNIDIIKGLFPIQKEYPNSHWECITSYKDFQGRIIGGCLDSLKDIIGTKYDKAKKFINKYKKDGIIWYFDVFEMTNEDILRTMWQLKKMNYFKYCKGIIFGRIREEISYTNINLKYAINNFLEDLNIPIIINADLGHTDPVFTIVNGSYVIFRKKDKYEMETIFK